MGLNLSSLIPILETNRRMTSDINIHIIFLIIWDKGVMVGLFHCIGEFSSINSTLIWLFQKHLTYELCYFHAIIFAILQENFVLKRQLIL